MYIQMTCGRKGRTGMGLMFALAVVQSHIGLI